MLFTILLSALIFISIGGGIIVYQTTSYNHEDSTAAFVSAVMIGGGLICFLILLGASSAAGNDTKNHVVTSEKTYTIAENSVPKVNGAKGELEFSYTENGQVSVFKEYVSPFEIGMEKPKAIKVTHYDTVDHSILPWVIGDSTKVELIK
jgi:hypothetical protein